MNYRDEQFDSLFDRDSALQIEDVCIENCSFDHCAFSLTQNIERRSTVRNAKLRNVRVGGCDIGPAVIEDVEVDGFETSDLLIVWGAFFENVKFRGNCGKIKINHWVHHTERSNSVQGPFDAARRAYYRSVECALDISKARFKEFECRGIPGRLIKRDPETQMLVTRERAMEANWQGQVSAKNVHWPFVLDLFLSDGDDDIVLVVPLAAPKKKRDGLLAGLNELRDLGVTVPD